MEDLERYSGGPLLSIPRQHSWDSSSLASPWVVEYYVSDSDEGGEEEQGQCCQHCNEVSGSHLPRWSESWSDEDFDQEKDALILVISANLNVIAFIAEANAVLLHAAGREAYTIDIETKHVK
uniref:Uncharacterized protein n=3 Tax=Oryza TaxID=4527 RepID=Q33B57_ORYSJ|nr:hypothetical protein LOC_Os10g04960 [Oryza sativa Japonica Group]